MTRWLPLVASCGALFSPPCSGLQLAPSHLCGPGNRRWKIAVLRVSQPNQIHAAGSQSVAGAESAEAPRAFAWTVCPGARLGEDDLVLKSWVDTGSLETPKKAGKSMRHVLTLAGFMLLSGTWVFAGTERTPNARELVILEARAAQASPKDRLFVYAELIDVATDLAVAQVRAGSEEQASATLETVRSYASRVDLRDAKGTKKLKNAEILLSRAEFRLRQLLMSAPLEDRPFLEKVLKRVSDLQSALLLRVFER